MAKREKKPGTASGSPSSETAPRPTTRALAAPVFAQPEPTADPSIFKIKHPTDSAAYKLIDELNAEHKIKPLPFSLPRGGEAEPQLNLTQVFGGNAAAVKRIQNSGQIVFHATGDCGSTRGPSTQNEVTDKMVGDFTKAAPTEVPQFALLLGDIVYNFGETEYYYDQFYEPYRNYSAPVLAVAGNHDGVISPLAHAASLAAYLRNFCADPADGYTVTPEAGGLRALAQQLGARALTQLVGRKLVVLGVQCHAVDACQRRCPQSLGCHAISLNTGVGLARLGLIMARR
jgi:Calcineurin-like phosphoesterase